MTGYHRRPLTLLLACLFSGGHAAQAAPLEDPPGNSEVEIPLDLSPSRLIPLLSDPAALQFADAQVLAPLALKASRRLQTTPPKDEAPQPAFLTADQVEGQTDEATVAEGNAELRKAGTLLSADKLTYRPRQDAVEAEGHVRLEQGGDEIKGPRLRLKLTEQEGVFESPEYKFSRIVTNTDYSKKSVAPGLVAMPMNTEPSRRLSTGYGQAERLNFEGENQFRIENGTYSTCKPEDGDWYAKGSEIRLDYDRDEGEARDATIYFKDVPFLYAPYLSFPLNNQRKSGVLAPTFTTSTRTGFDFSLPIYWNIAPNYDATLTPRAMTKRGLQLGGELRYLDSTSEGQAQMEYMSKDKQLGDTRYAYALNFTKQLGGGFWSDLDWNGVSDDNYFTDLSSRVVDTSQRQLARHITLGYQDSWWASNLEVLRYQTLQPDDTSPVSSPYFLEPRVSFNARLPEWKGTDIGLLGQFTSFTHPDLVQGKRTVLYPQVALPYVDPGFYITPKIGVHATHYQLTQNDADTPDSINRVMPIFAVDSGMTFERETHFGGKDWTQTLEPRLYYLYVPYRDQSKIPVFDTAQADFNFAQIFNENRYSGYDRISDAHELTAALSTRLIDPATGAERARAMVGQRYYFNTPRVGLPDETPSTDKFSDFLAAFTGQVAPKTYMDLAWEYNFNNSTNERFTVASRFQPDLGKVLSAAYRYNRNSVDQIDLSGQWNLSGNWHAVGRYNYSFDDRRLVEVLGGLEYNAGCWVGRFVAQRLEVIGGSPNTNFFFQLELNDFGQIGSNPLQALSRSVPGYSKINEQSANSLLTNE